MHKSLVSVQPHLRRKPATSRSAKVLVASSFIAASQRPSQSLLKERGTVLKGHGFSRAVKALLISCRERASARERLAFPTALLVALLALTALSPTRLTAQQPANQSEQSSSTPAQAFDLSDEVVRDVFSPFRIAIETRNFDLLLSLFDRESMKDFPQVRDEFAAFFRLHDNLKFRYQLLQATADKDIAFATADIDMDAEPRDDLSTEQRRSTQMRFQMKQTSKGWRLTGIQPMDFFSK